MTSAVRHEGGSCRAKANRAGLNDDDDDLDDDYNILKKNRASSGRKNSLIPIHMSA